MSDGVSPALIAPIAGTAPLQQVIHGDCREELPKLATESIHLLVTDPPYYLDGLDSSWRKGRASAKRSTGCVGGLPVGMKFDPGQGRKLQDFMAGTGRLIHRVMKPGAFAIVFSQPRLVHRMASGLEDAGFEIRDVLAWHFTRKAQFKAFSMDHFIDRMSVSEAARDRIKRSLGGRRTPQLRPQFEAMILAQKPKIGTHVENWLAHETGLIDAGASLNGCVPSTIMTVEKADRETYNCHLTVKPLRLVEHLIRLFSVSGQTVLDPFAGSGTTIVAARAQGRGCIGIEIERDYVRIAEERLRPRREHD